MADGSGDPPIGSPEQLIRTAYHEAGHVVVGWVALEREIPAGGANIVRVDDRLGGADWADELKFDMRGVKTGDPQTRSHAANVVCMLVAGQVSAHLFKQQPEIFRGHPEYQLANSIWFDLDGQAWLDGGLSVPEARARSILEQRRGLVERLVGELLARKEMTRDELAALLGSRY
jgi:ATP-dependent Zn protease